MLYRKNYAPLPSKIYFSNKKLVWYHVSPAAAKSLQSCPTLCNPKDGSPPGSPIPEILQVRTLEWVAVSFSSAWKWKVKVKLLSCIQLLATPWTAARQASLSIANSQSLLKLMSIESVMPSNHLILCRSLLLPPSVFPSIRVSSSHQVAKVLEFQLQHRFSQWIFRTDFI